MAPKGAIVLCASKNVPEKFPFPLAIGNGMEAVLSKRGKVGKARRGKGMQRIMSDPCFQEILSIPV